MEDQKPTPLIVRLPMMAHLASVSPRTICNLQAERVIPVVRIGRCVRYNPVEVLAAIVRNGRVAAVGEPKRKMQRLTAANLGVQA